jgi:undecaprenyl pyrophosphate phosphatase UppP
MGPQKDQKSLVLREVLLAIIQGLNEWIPRPAQGEIFLPLHVVRMELNVYRFPDDTFYTSGFLGQWIQ